MKNAIENFKCLFTNKQTIIRKKRVKSKFRLFLLLYWPLKLCVCDFAGQSLHWSIILQGKE